MGIGPETRIDNTASVYVQLADDGLLDIGGKVVDGSHGGVDVVLERDDVATGHLRDDDADAGPGFTADFIHEADAIDGILDALADDLLDLFGRGAGEHHAGPRPRRRLKSGKVSRRSWLIDSTPLMMNISISRFAAVGCWAKNRIIGGASRRWPGR